MTTVFLKAEGKQHGEFCEIDQRSGTIRLDATTGRLDQLRLAVPTRGAVYGAALNFKGTLARIGSALFEDPYKRPPKCSGVVYETGEHMDWAWWDDSMLQTGLAVADGRNPRCCDR